MKKIFILCIVLSGFLNAFTQPEKKPITIEDLWKNYTFSPEGVPGFTSLSDGRFYVAVDKGKNLLKYEFKTGKVIDTIVTVDRINDQRIKNLGNYELSANEDKILLYINARTIYRYSFTADYFVWDLKQKKLIPVSENGQQRLATFSPDGSKIAFIRDNNLFIKSFSNNEEIKITQDGKFNAIINGASDWVYEEEFGLKKAFSWSTDSKYLAYIRFDESKVKEYSILFYKASNPELTENALYPMVYTYKYPKAGEANSIVSVHIYHVETQKTIQANTGEETDQYIPRIKWIPGDEKLCIYRLNRLQNKLELLKTDITTGKSEVFITETNACYIDEKILNSVTFINNAKNVLLLSERDGYMHIFLYNADGTLKNQVTKGNWDVTDFYGYDAKSNRIFYSSSEVSPLQRIVYSIKPDGSDKKQLSAGNGTNRMNFNADYTYFINRFQTANEPPLITLHEISGKLVRVLEDNKKLKDTLQYYQYSKKEFFTFKTSEGFDLNGYMIKPWNFDPAKKYPVLMTQYSGPNSQEVTDVFGIEWDHVLACEGYMVVCVDGRGTGARGERFRKITYLQLGKYETTDQIETARYLKTLPYVDSTRIGIWGWSYGGFMTLLCMTRGSAEFKAGIAVAPVTNWRYYDNIYTERFMRTPQENPDGYDQNSPINHASGLKGKLLIIHGDVDDNVHPQNTMEMVDKLVQENKQFDMFIYPNRNHSIYGGNVRYHLFTKMNRWILENL